ncbi:hypothetical protein DMI65_04085 [Escherichia coli]|nr:hypothetical protein [Escherichia coli]
MQFNVDKQNSPSVRRVLYQNRENRMHLKVDDEVVFLYVVLFFLYWRASDVRIPPAQAGLF